MNQILSYTPAQIVFKVEIKKKALQGNLTKKKICIMLCVGDFKRHYAILQRSFQHINKSKTSKSASNI